MEQRKRVIDHGIMHELIERDKKREKESLKKKEKAAIKNATMIRQKKEAKRSLRIKIETVISIVFTAGMIGLLLTRMSGVYEMQREYNTLVSDSRVTHRNNEDLRAKIMKYDNITQLTERAKELPLAVIGEDNTLRVNMNRNNFKEEQIVSEGKWIDKISDKFVEWTEKLL